MKDSRSLSLIIVSILLIGVSLILLWTWGYNFGTQRVADESKVIVVRDSSNAMVPERDSLFHLYFEAMRNLNELDAALNRADSLKTDINTKLGEFYQLRDELIGMLNKPIDRKGVKSADEKMQELQIRMDQLKVQNNNIERENKRLSALINRLPIEMKIKTSSVPDSSASLATATPVDSASLTSSASVAHVKKMNFYGNAEQSGENAMADSADRMEKFNGSFDFVTSEGSSSSGVIYVVITCPDGKIMRSSSWDSGSFETKDGRKPYTCRVKYDGQPSELQTLQFSVPSDSFQKGEYKVAFYLDGMVIAMGKKLLF